MAQPTTKTSPSEKSLTRDILKELRASGGFWTKIHGSPYQRVGLPDILGCLEGHFIAIEVKRPGEKPTLLQTKALEDLKNAGATVGVATSVLEARAIVRGAFGVVPNVR